MGWREEREREDARRAAAFDIGAHPLALAVMGLRLATKWGPAAPMSASSAALHDFDLEGGMRPSSANDMLFRPAGEYAAGLFAAELSGAERLHVEDAKRAFGEGLEAVCAGFEREFGAAVREEMGEGGMEFAFANFGANCAGCFLGSLEELAGAEGELFDPEGRRWLTDGSDWGNWEKVLADSAARESAKGERLAKFMAEAFAPLRRAFKEGLSVGVGMLAATEDDSDMGGLGAWSLGARGRFQLPDFQMGCAALGELGRRGFPMARLAKAGCVASSAIEERVMDMGHPMRGRELLREAYADGVAGFAATAALAEAMEISEDVAAGRASKAKASPL